MRAIRRKKWIAASLVVIVAIGLVLGRAAAQRICQGARTGSKPFASAVPLGAAVVWQDVKNSPAYGQFFLDHYQWITARAA